MRLLDLKMWSTQDHAKALHNVADAIIRVDGDRDHMNHSDLKCEQTQAIAQYLRSLAVKMEAAE